VRANDLASGRLDLRISLFSYRRHPARFKTDGRYAIIASFGRSLPTPLRVHD